jgi:quercetin dioxygenase-like cupin family protein
VGSSSDKASKQAAANEAQTKAQIAQADAGINAIYDNPSRQAEYDKLRTDTTKFYTDDVNSQQAIAARKLKFSLARSGLTGGSQQAAEGEQLGKDYDKAIIGAQQKGNAAASNLRGADESSRMNLLAMAQSGLDAGTAQSQATSSLQNNLLAGESTATADSFANAFGDLGTVYQNSEDQKAARQGLYARKITLPAGSLAVGKKHKTTHISVLAKGHIAVRGVNGKPDHHMRAGDTMVTPAGSQRAVYAFEESVFVCIHATDETDLEKLEAQLIEAPMLEGPP